MMKYSCNALHYYDFVVYWVVILDRYRHAAYGMTPGFLAYTLVRICELLTLQRESHIRIPGTLPTHALADNIRLEKKGGLFAIIVIGFDASIASNSPVHPEPNLNEQEKSFTPKKAPYVSGVGWTSRT